MTARVIKGSKQEIAAAVAAMDGDVREAIVFVDEPATVDATPKPPDEEAGEDMFKEMEPYMVDVGDVDYSREAIYTRQPGE